MRRNSTFTAVTLATLLFAASSTVLAQQPQAGDLDRDGSVSIADAFLLLDDLSGKNPLAGEQLDIADVNGDGLVDFLDAVHILALIELDKSKGHAIARVSLELDPVSGEAVATITDPATGLSGRAIIDNLFNPMPPGTSGASCLNCGGCGGPPFSTRTVRVALTYVGVPSQGAVGAVNCTATQSGLPINVIAGVRSIAPAGLPMNPGNLLTTDITVQLISCDHFTLFFSIDNTVNTVCGF